MINKNYEVVDESLKQAIKHKTIRNASTRDGCFARYAGRLYYVNYKEDKVTLQLERKQ